MFGDSPKRLLQLRRGEQEPTIDLRAFVGADRQKLFLAILFREIENDGYGFRENQVIVDEYRQFRGRVDFEKFRASMFIKVHVDTDGFEWNADFLQRPTYADRTGG